MLCISFDKTSVKCRSAYRLGHVLPSTWQGVSAPLS